MLEEGNHHKPVVDHEVGDQVDDGHLLPAADVGKQADERKGDQETNVTPNNLALLTGAEDGRLGVKVWR